MASRIGRSTRSTFGRRPAQMPTGMPIRSAIVTETITRASVSIAASQTPSNPNESTPRAVSTASFHPASTPASAAAPTTSPSQVIRSRTATVLSSKTSTVFSIGDKK